MTNSDNPAAALTFYVAVDEEPTDSTMGLFRKGEREVALRSIPIAVLRSSLRKTVEALREVMEDVPRQAGGLSLREAQFSFEVSAKGGVNLIGTTEIGAEGAITLIFRE